MRVILSGDELEVKKIMKENRLRASRGLVSFEAIEDSSKKEKKKVEPAPESKGGVEMRGFKE